MNHGIASVHVRALPTLDAFNSQRFLAEAVERSTHIYARCRCVSSLRILTALALPFFVFVIVGFLSIPRERIFSFHVFNGKIFRGGGVFFHVLLFLYFPS